MRLIFRETQSNDIPGLFSIRARTRENRLSIETLASMGITPESVAASMAGGRVKGWLCLHEGAPIAFCNGDAETGEVLVLAVLPEYEGRGIGRRLLFQVTNWLRSAGCTRIWLAANPDPATRAYGFYRSQGWQPSGERLEHGDEILVSASLTAQSSDQSK
jgi:GNAT superfamily N-acetyltransferase